jgi:DNA-binding MarR family transcriptional regulator
MAGSISSDIEVTEFAGQLFFRLWRASHTRTADALTSVGLTPALFAVLKVLGAREGTIQQQLSSDMGIDPSAMVKLINELEDAGLADRRQLLTLLRRALASAPAQPAWRAEDGD